MGIVQSKANASLPSYGIKVLLLGQTGSGKTSFLNLLCNADTVMKYGANEEGYERFTTFNDMRCETSLEDKMVSKTDAATRYDVKLGDLKLYVIDTPGFGDTRRTDKDGQDIDQKHVKKIIKAVKEEKELNVICFVVNGRSARMTATEKYVLTQITALLPKKSQNNIIVVFTNCADALELTYDIASIEAFLDRKMDDRFFCIENPFCKVEKAKTANVPKARVWKSVMRSFEDTMKELESLAECCLLFPPVASKDFERLNNAKEGIELRIGQVLAAMNNATKKKKLVSDALRDCNTAKDLAELNKCYESTKRWEEWDIVPETGDKKNTLCYASGCHHNCHIGCELPLVADDADDKDKRFRECPAFRLNRKKFRIATQGDKASFIDNCSEESMKWGNPETGAFGNPRPTLRVKAEFECGGCTCGKNGYFNLSGVHGASRKDLDNASLPIDATVFDWTEPNKCKINGCGHDVSLHRHVRGRWAKVEKTRVETDEKKRELFEEQLSLAESKARSKTNLEAELNAIEAEKAKNQAEMSKLLTEFEQLGLSRGYIKVLQVQKDLIVDHMQAYQDEHPGEENDSLAVALKEVNARLSVVRSELVENDKVGKHDQKEFLTPEAGAPTRGLWSVIGMEEFSRITTGLVWSGFGMRGLTADPGTTPLFHYIKNQWTKTTTPNRILRRIELLSVPDKEAAITQHFKTVEIGRGVPGGPLNPANIDTEEFTAGLSKLRENFLPLPRRSRANYLLTWHGTGYDDRYKVATSGLHPLRTTDGGYFGAGSYTTLNASYAAYYSEMKAQGPDGEYAVLLVATCVGCAYVITRGRDYADRVSPSATSRFFGATPDDAKAIKAGYDTHFVPVREPSNQACSVCDATSFEIVSRDVGQTCPVAVCYYTTK